MNGPQHYREAEGHLSRASHLRAPDAGPLDPDAAAHALAMAQAHATLALAAAVAMAHAGPDGMARVDFKAWDNIAGVQAHPTTQDTAGQEG